MTTSYGDHFELSTVLMVESEKIRFLARLPTNPPNTHTVNCVQRETLLFHWYYLIWQINYVRFNCPRPTVNPFNTKVSCKWSVPQSILESWPRVIPKLPGLGRLINLIVNFYNLTS